MRVIRALVASDLTLCREGLRLLLGALDDVEPVGAVPVADIGEHLAADEPDVVVLAVLPAPGAGPQLAATTRLLRDAGRGTGLVVIAPNGGGLVRPLLEDGPRGVAFLLDDRVTDVDVLARALRDAADGMVSMDADSADALLGRGHPALTALSARERDVLAELARGLSNHAIAESLQLTVKSVEANVSSIFRRLGLELDAGKDRRVSAALLYLTGRL